MGSRIQGKLIEFRDKFARQLELKLRDLQRSDSSGVPPLSLQFLSDLDGQPIGDKLSVNLERLIVTGTEVAKEDKKEKLAEFVQEIAKSRSYVPIALGITNSSSSGIRNLYVELQLSSDNDSVEITNSVERGIMSGLGSDIVWVGGSSREELLESKLLKRVEPNLENFEKDRLRPTGPRAWRLMYEWDAIQPHRVRLVRPVLYVYCEARSEISIVAKVFADSFPEPLELRVAMVVDPVNTSVELTTLLPKWEELLDKYEKTDSPLRWRRLRSTPTIGKLL